MPTDEEPPEVTSAPNRSRPRRPTNLRPVLDELSDTHHAVSVLEERVAELIEENAMLADVIRAQADRVAATDWLRNQLWEYVGQTGKYSGRNAPAISALNADTVARLSE